MHYDDFVLQIEPGPDDNFEARVLQSPAGEGRAPMRLDVEDAVLDELIHTVARRIRNHSNGRPQTREIVRRHKVTQLIPQEIGASLFRGAFSGQVLSLLDRSLGRLAAAQDCGLRIKLKFQGNDPRLSRLAALPWELLCRSETEDYLGLDRRTPLVRYIDVPRPRHQIPRPTILRILVVVASPRNLEVLNLRDELKNLFAAWKKQNGVEIKTLEQANLASLREVLSEKDYHVLHFMGHGGFDPNNGKGVLYFESKQGHAVPVNGRSLAAKLKDHSSLGLIFLNACNTGKFAGGNELQPFAGVATALVQGGLPAVLAMQFPISDNAAICFSQTFYRHLATGSKVDEAVTEGRQAVHSADPTTIEWATPVLFIRTADGNIFHRTNPSLNKPSRTFPATSLFVIALTAAVQASINKVVYRLAMGLEEPKWQGSVLSVVGSTVRINAGASIGMQLGHKLSCILKGEPLIDPATGLELGFTKSTIGTMTVTEVEENYSVAQIVNGCQGLGYGDFVEFESVETQQVSTANP